MGAEYFNGQVIGWGSEVLCSLSVIRWTVSQLYAFHGGTSSLSIENGPNGC